ncbi:MAG TPA: alpha/beta fold hydrolase [Planctomycetota bacterium]|nr:alpha/beta fold hydrolase [Planctomycetota bacterium]
MNSTAHASPHPVPGYVKALDGAPLYCVYHPAQPVANPQRRYYPVLLLPPLFEERKSAYAALRRLAERLAAAGHAALRFDYRGSGESGGVPAARRWQHLADDCAVARKTLARLAGQRDAVLLGLRLGATLALQETIRAGGEAVLALAPVLKGATQVRLWKMRSKIRSELTVGASAGEPPAPQQRAEVFDFDGFDVSKEFFDDVARIDLIKDLGSPSCPSLVMQLSHRSEAAPETVELMKVLGSRAKNICLRIEPFWENVDDVETAPLEDAVLNWLKQT